MGEPTLTPRERILALLEEEPGLHLRELPRRLGLSLRSVRYHLDALAEADAVQSHRAGRYERWFPTGSFSSEDRALISALRVRGQRLILVRLLRGGPMRFAALHQATSLSSASLAVYLDRLAADDIIALGADRAYGLRDIEATRMRLALYRQRFPDLLADAAAEIFDETR